MIVCGKKLFFQYYVEVEICLYLWEWAALVRLDAGIKYCCAGTSIHQVVDNPKHHGELGFCSSGF